VAQQVIQVAQLDYLLLQLVIQAVLLENRWVQPNMGELLEKSLQLDS
jgi:hypothetical protein